MENAARGQYLKALLVLSGVHATGSLVLFVLGFVASSVHGPVRQDIPVYYTGPLIAAPLNLLLAVIGLAIYVRGKNCENKREAAQRIGSLMLAFCVGVLISEVGHIIALMITGNTGVVSAPKCSYLIAESTNRRLAIASVVFISVGAISSIVGVVVVCLFSASFGLKIFGRSRRQVGVDPSQTHTDIFRVNSPASPRQEELVTTPREDELVTPAVDEHAHSDSGSRNHVVETLNEISGKFSHPTIHHHQETRRHLDHLVYEKKHKTQKRKKTKKGSNGNNGRKRNGREASYELPPLPGIGRPVLTAPRPSPPPPQTSDASTSSPSPHLTSPTPPPSSPTPSIGKYNIPSISINTTPVFPHSPPPPYSPTDDMPNRIPRVVFVRSASPPSVCSSPPPDTPPSSGRLLVEYLKPTSHSPPPMPIDSRSTSPSLDSDDFPNPLNPHSEPPPPRPITPPLLKPTRLFVKPAAHRHNHNFVTPTDSDPELADLPDLSEPVPSPHLYHGRPTTPPSYMAMITTRPLNDVDR